MKKAAEYLERINYWAIILLPFSVAIAPGAISAFMVLTIVPFLTKKLISRERLFIRSPLWLPLGLFFLVNCLSIINSPSLRDSLKGGVFRLSGYIFLFFIVAEQVKDIRHLRRIFASLYAGLVLISCDALWQVFRGADFIQGYKPIVNIGLVRATASFKDANILGIYLSGFFPLLAGLTFFYFKGRAKLAGLTACLLAMIAICLTYSRPTLLAVYVTFLFLALAMRQKVILAILVIFTAASPFLLPASVKEWVRSVDYNPLRMMCNDDRIAVYQHSLNMIRAHPLIGVGTNAFMKSYKKYKNYPEYRGVVTLDEMKAHDNFLQMAGETGLLGLGFFLWFLWGVFKRGRRACLNGDGLYLKIFAVSLCACLVAFLVNGLTESSLYYSRVALVFWYLAGLLIALEKFIPLEPGQSS